jgi:adenine/guanine phosphoribosyltransferase-like PRPP-binding protein
MPEKATYHNEILQIESLSPEIIRQKTERVEKSFFGVPIYRNYKGKKGYPYCQFEFTADKEFSASLFTDAADLFINSDPVIFENADVILSEGDRGGGPLAQAIGLKTDIPIILANWHKKIPDNLPDVQIVKTEIGFSGKGHIVVSGIKPGQRVILVDDLLSSGGTAEALIKAVEAAGATVVKAFFVGEKIDQKGRERLKQFPNIEVTTLAKFIAKGKYTIDPRRLVELIGSSRPFDSMENIHQIDSFRSLIYDQIIKEYKKSLLKRIFHNDPEKIRDEIMIKIEKIIGEIKLNYVHSQMVGSDEYFMQKATELVAKYLLEEE